MSSIQETIKERQRAMLPSRLLRGAEVIGTLRRTGQFCTGGWSPGCSCSPKSDFCVAKERWIALYGEYAAWKGVDTAWMLSPATNRFALIEAMTVRQFEATGLTALVEVPFCEKPIRVGPKGTIWGTIVDLGVIWNGESLTGDNTDYSKTDYIEALKAVEKLQGAFS